MSLDSSFGIVDYDDPSSAGLVGRTGGLIAFVGGIGSAVALLTTSWRPVKKTEESS